MHDLKAVFWDLDGTLADTEMNGHRVAFNKAFEEFKISWYWDEHLYGQLLSISGGKNRIRYYSDQIGYKISTTTNEKLHRAKQSYYSNIIKQNKISLRRGVSRLLLELSNQNVEQWIVTTSSSLAVHSLIDNSDQLREILFKGIITSDDVQKTKPDPSCFNKAIKDSGIGRESILVIEDSYIGVKSATNAGLKCVATPSIWDSQIPNILSHISSAVDHLGDPSCFSKVISGPSCPKGYIDFNFLQSLLNN